MARCSCDGLAALLSWSSFFSPSSFFLSPKTDWRGVRNSSLRHRPAAVLCSCKLAKASLQYLEPIGITCQIESACLPALLSSLSLFCQLSPHSHLTALLQTPSSAPVRLGRLQPATLVESHVPCTCALFQGPHTTACTLGPCPSWPRSTVSAHPLPPCSEQLGVCALPRPSAGWINLMQFQCHEAIL